MFPLTFVGGAVGWEAAKAILFPMIVWSGTVAGGAAYVHWVIKSHNANVVRQLNGANAQPTVGDIQPSQFVDDLSELIETRVNFISAYRDSPNTFYVSSKIEGMRAEDAKVLAAADQLKTRASDAFTSDIAAKSSQLQGLDDQLKSWNDRLAGAGRVPNTP